VFFTTGSPADHTRAQDLEFLEIYIKLEARTTGTQDKQQLHREGGLIMPVRSTSRSSIL
jgi:hypothetical protein